MGEDAYKARIRTTIGEHNYNKVACSEYCRMDKAFCPLAAKKASVDVKRWGEVQNGGSYKADWNLQFDDAPERELRYSPFSCWGDGSGFEYDIMPENLVGPSGCMESLYDLHYYPISHEAMRLSEWNSWLDKFQRDYRFGQVSDKNAETLLFPNVDDPWMFTEYVFKGVGERELVVRPDLYDEETLEISNADWELPLGESPEAVETRSKYETVREENGRVFAHRNRVTMDWNELVERKDADGNLIPSTTKGFVLYHVDVPVQSVKWGEHGNVPPHTINMAAPKNWMDAGKANAVVTPKFVAHVGAPFYASSYGVVYWHNGNAFVDGDFQPGLVSGEVPFYEYAIKEDGDHGVPQNTPAEIRTTNYSSGGGLAKTNIHLSTGDLSHGGCSFFEGKGGRARCTAMDGMSGAELETLRGHFSFDGCSGYESGSKCPYRVPGSQYPILADYEVEAANMAEYREKTMGIFHTDENYNAADKRMASVILNGGMYMNNGMYPALFLQGRPDVYNETQVNVWYESSFDVKYENSNPVRLTGTAAGTDGFGKGVRVERGTGKHAVDSKENADAFKGDTPYFGDMSQQSFHRWFATPMFCADGAWCNATYGDLMTGGWDARKLAGKSGGGCRYYRSPSKSDCSCPYHGIHKRAYEYGMAMENSTRTLTVVAGSWHDMDEDERKDFNSDTYRFMPNGRTKDGFDIFDIWCSDEAVFSGLGCKVAETDGDWRKIGRFSMRSRDDVYFWYDALDNDGNVLETWFCKCDESYTTPKRNLVLIDNDEKFIGGYHPQYKDYSKRGEEYMMDVESDSYRDAMGDIIGDVDFDGQPQITNKKGYWTDEDGEYIVDERSVGIENKVATQGERENGVGTTTISFQKSNTEIDVENSKNVQPKTLHCAVNANDSFSLLARYRESRLPQYNDPDDSGKTYWASPYVADPYALPTMRRAAHCGKCDYYLAWKYHGMTCPWCGSPLDEVTGDKGFAGEGKTWGEMQEEAGGEQEGEGQEGGEESHAGELNVVRKFFKLNSIGKVQVWAYPGTCVPADGYYWKSPAVVSNSLVRQIRYRLGTFGGTAWNLDMMSRERDMTLGYPEQVGKFAPMPDYDPVGERETPFLGLKWEGVTKEHRSRYASYNSHQPQNPIPQLALDKSSEDKVLPYTADPEDGLKIATAAQILALRNLVQPVFAYSTDTQGEDYPRMRASYEKRTTADVPRYSLTTSCRCDGLLRAANDTGNDAYVQFWSGDYEWGSVREYYPPGLSWWWLNDVLGGRYSPNTDGQYHMEAGLGEDPPFGPNGGKRVVSKYALPIHGILPLDKDIVKAYAIFFPMGEPSKEPIGRGWNGVVHYWHYHAMPETHKECGREAHLHGQAGYPGVWDEEGNYHGSVNWREEEANGGSAAAEMESNGGAFVPMDEGEYESWGTDEGKPEDYRSIYDDGFERRWKGLSGVKDVGFWKQVGAARETVGDDRIAVYRPHNGDRHDNGIKNGGFYYARKNDADANHTMKFRYVGLDGDGALRRMYTKGETWQELSRDEMESMVGESLVGVSLVVSDGTAEGEVSRDFEQFSEKFSTETMPRQTQDVAGYYEFQGGGRMPASVRFAEKPAAEEFDNPVIYQSETATVTVGEREAGIVARGIDITWPFKKLYDDRIERRFYCSAGKSYAEIEGWVFPAPEWEGVGDWKDEEQCRRHNSQEFAEGFGGYLLNPPFAYPKIDSDGSIPTPNSEGDRMEESTFTLEIRSTFLPYVDIEDGELSVETNGEKRTLDLSGVYDTPESVETALSEIFKGFDVEMLSPTSAVAVKEGGEAVEVVLEGEAVLSAFGLEERYSSTQDRCTYCSDHVGGFRPRADGKWVSNTFEHGTQRAVFDLARSPLVLSRRDYRYNAPTFDCSNVVCPNESCASRVRGMTQALYARTIKMTYGRGRSTCIECGTNLSGQDGVVSIPGDGLDTWKYDAPFMEDSFVTGFVVGCESKSTFRVLAKRSAWDSWEPLLISEYDEEEGRRKTTFDGVVSGDRYVLEKPVMARYVQVEAEQERTEVALEYGVARKTEYMVEAKGEFKELGNFDWHGEECTISYKEEGGGTGALKMEISTAYVQDEGKTLRIGFASAVPEGAFRARVVAPRHLVSMSGFKFYGCVARKGELTMTDPPSVEKFTFMPTRKYYAMRTYPSQIKKVVVCTGDGGGVKLTRENDEKAAMKYTAAKKTVPVKNWKGETELKTAYVLLEGRWRFDYERNRIELPTVASTPDGDKDVSALEDEISSYNESYLPTVVSVEYWAGIGLPVTLEAQAEGMGPSYQLEKDTVTNVVDAGALPKNGISEPYPDGEGKMVKKEVPWTCTNHVCSTLDYSTQVITGGKFLPPNVGTTYLSTSVDDDKKLVDVFGENCQNIRGRCKTQVTLYGASDQIVSGRFLVSAPAYRNGEPTGGIKDGVLVFKAVVKDRETRATLAFSKPILLVYAVDRETGANATGGKKN